MINESGFLGPFIGYTTCDSAKIWMYVEQYEELFLKIYSQENDIQIQTLDFTNEIKADCVQFFGLKADTKYRYELFTDKSCINKIKIPSLEDEDFYFYTMPNEPTEDNSKYQYDFLVLSCNNPFRDKESGWYVWETLPNILEETTKNQKTRVLFAIFAGDQIYADIIEKKVLNENDPNLRLQYYINIYKEFWSNKAYRKILCSLPSYLMWDDHDITDGWGSREESFDPDTNQPKQNWKNLFNTAKDAFSAMQATRNPDPLSKQGFDTAFTVGKMGFVLADLRSNRNIKQNQIWSNVQFDEIKAWIEHNRENIDILFFVSPVVFAHGSPTIERNILSCWPPLHAAIDNIWEIQHNYGQCAKNLTNWMALLLIVCGFFF